MNINRNIMCLQLVEACTLSGSYFFHMLIRLMYLNNIDRTLRANSLTCKCRQGLKKSFQLATSELPCASVPRGVLVRNLSNPNVFRLHTHFLSSVQRLVLKQRNKLTRKWPIILFSHSGWSTGDRFYLYKLRCGSKPSVS